MKFSTTLTLIILFALLLQALVEASTNTDFYAILGLKRTAKKEEIRKAYLKLSRKYHPDKMPGNKEAEQKFIEISHAYEALYDDKKRKIYDQYGEEGLKREAQGGGEGFHDPFEMFMQFTRGFGGASGRESEERKGPDINMEIQVTLADLFLGKSIEVEIDRRGICPKCDGSGAKNSKDVKTCHVCGGRGIRIVKHMLAPGMFQQMQTTCDECKGTGKVIKSKCDHCHGKKVVRETEILDVQIEKGMPDGHVIVFEASGDREAEENVEPGDVKFILKTKPHPIFTRRGDNLYVKEVITLEEALNGFRKELTMLDGTSKVVLERKSLTPPGYVQQIDGEGMFLYTNGQSDEERGKLYVEYQVVFPVGKKFSAEDKQTISKLLGGDSVSYSKSANAQQTVFQ